MPSTFRCGGKILPAVLAALIMVCGGGLICRAQNSVNDAFTNAIPLYGSEVTFGGSFSNATYETGESACTSGHCFDSPGAGSLWWSWTATNSTAVVIDVLEYFNHSQPYGLTGFAVHDATNITDVASGTEMDWNYLLDPNCCYYAMRRYIAFSAIAGKTYHIRVFGNKAENFTLRLTATNSPMIFRTSGDQIAAAGENAVFSVYAAGRQPLKYQWLFEGNVLADQTKPSLLLRGLTTNQIGGYSVVVSTASGAVTSAIAHLSLSPADSRPLLTAATGPDTNRFYFNLTGVPYRIYQIQSTTNLVDWLKEESNFCPDYVSDCEPGIAAVQYFGTNSFSIQRTSQQKFFRATLYSSTWMCIANLTELAAGQALWAVEGKHYGDSPVTWADLEPYISGDERCPHGGTSLADSYLIYDAATLPTCKKIWYLHVLP